MNQKDKFEALRAKAEEFINSNNINDVDFKSKNIKELVEELSIYRIELEMQNDELKQTNSVLQIEKEKYKELYDNAPTAYFTLNKTGNIIDLNQAAANLLSKKKHKFKYTSIFPYLDDDSKVEFSKYFKSVFDSADIKSTALVFIANNNKRIYSKLQTQSYFDYELKENLCRLTLTDISEIKEAAKTEMKLKDDLFHSLFQNMSDAVLFQEPESGKILFANKTAEIEYGYSEKEFKGMHINQVVHKKHLKYVSSRLEKISKKNRYIFESLHISKLGKEIPVEISATLSKIGNQELIISIIRNISERKNTQKTLAEKNYQLGERVKELRGLYGVSNLINDKKLSFEDVLMKAVEVIPPAFQYPEITMASISYNNKNYQTNKFKKSPYKLSTAIIVNNTKVGFIDVLYEKEMPELDEGPFLKEERSLIEGMAKLLGSYIERYQSSKTIHNLNNRIESAMITGNIAWWEVSLPSGVVTFNENKTQMLGYKKEDFTHYSHFMKHVHPDDYEHTMEAFKDLVSGKKNLYNCEYRIKSKSGKYLWFKDLGKITENNNGEIKVSGIVMNLTKRKKAEIALDHNNNKLETIVNNIPEFLFHLNSEGNFIAHYQNDNSKLLYKPNEFIGKNIFDLFDKDFADNMQKAIAQTLKTGNYKYQYTLKIENQTRYYEANYSKLSYNEVIALVRDITEEEVYKKKIADNEEKLNIIINNFPSGSINLINKERKFEIAGGADFYKHEINPISFIGKKINEVLSEKTVKKAEQAIEKAFKGESAIYETMLGNTYYRSFAEPVYDENNEIKYVILINKDVTKSIEAEQKLKDSEEKFRQLFNFMPVGVSISDNIGNIIDSNIHARQLLGLTKEEQEKRKIDGVEWKIIRKDSTPMPPEEFASVIALKEQKQVSNVEMGILKSNDDITWINVSAAPLVTDKNNVVIAYTDITEQVIRQNKIEEYSKQLKSANATKDKFFSIIAHDLKTPFNSLLGFSDLLLRNIRKYDIEKTENIITQISNSSNKAYKLLENLLEWSRSQSGRISYNPEPIVLENEISQTIEILYTQAENKEIKINQHIKSGLMVKADHNMLHTILRNLISNAIKFSYRNSKIDIYAIKEENFISIEIKDYGVGMKPETAQKLFKIEEKVSVPGTERESGTGLGLILCKEFVEQHSGNIIVKSTPEKGSSFIVKLPAAE